MLFIGVGELSQFPEGLASGESPFSRSHSAVKPLGPCAWDSTPVCVRKTSGLERQGQGNRLNQQPVVPCAELWRLGFMMLPSRRNLLQQRAAFDGTATLFLGCSAVEQRWMSQRERKSLGVWVQKAAARCQETGGRAFLVPGPGLPLLETGWCFCPCSSWVSPCAPAQAAGLFPGASVHI